MSRIFISYRRDDSAADMTDRLYERLAQRWGRRVFMDIDSLVAGDLFEKAIEENLQNCRVMLVIIGRHWASLTDEAGLRSIDNPRDYPRMEVAAALRRGVRVIPVLVGDAELPKREELPDEIAGLVDRQYVRVSRERFAADVQQLIEAIAGEMPLRSWRQPPWHATALVVVLLAAGTAAYFALVHDDASKDLAMPSATDAPPGKVETPVSPTREPGTGTPSEVLAATGPADPSKASVRGEKATTGKAVGPAPVKRENDRSTAPVSVAGRWTTAPVEAAYGNPKFTLLLEFTQLDDTLLGTVTQTYEGRSRGVSRAIFEGKIKNDVISFHTKGEVTGGPNGTFVPYREMYLGTLRKDGREIAFRRFNDVSSGGEIETFVAVR